MHVRKCSHTPIHQAEPVTVFLCTQYITVKPKHKHFVYADTSVWDSKPHELSLVYQHIQFKYNSYSHDTTIHRFVAAGTQTNN